MAEVKSLRKENELLKAQIRELSEDMKSPREKFDQRLPSQTQNTELMDQAKSLQYLSDQYEEFVSFKKFAEVELKRMATKLTETTIEVNEAAEHIDAFEEYIYVVIITTYRLLVFLKVLTLNHSTPRLICV